MERSRNIPLFFEIYSGSIPDVVTLKRTVEGIRKLIPKIEIILDRGMLFIFFISLIIRTALMRGMVSSGLMKNYSLERMIPELEKLHVVEDASGNITELERTRKQKDILEALEKVSWW